MKTNTRENDYIRRINPPCSERKGGAVSTSRRNNTTESSPTYEFYSASASQEMLNERYFSTSETSRFTAGNKALTPPPFFLSSSPLHTSASRRTRFVPQTTAARRGAAPRQTHFEDGRSRVEMTAGFVRPRTMRVVLCAVIVLRRPTLLWH